MKRTTFFILAALCAAPSIHPALWATPVELRNTTGTELNVELLSTEGGQVTFTRIEDGMEFTIPVSMLDKPSQQKVMQWKYLPDSVPFFKLDDQYVIPIDIEGNTLTYFGPDSQKQEVNLPEAQKLKTLVEQNKTAFSKNGRKRFGRMHSITNGNNPMIVSQNGATAIFEDRNKENAFGITKDNLSDNKEPPLQEISYEIFLPADIQQAFSSTTLATFFSTIKPESHPLGEEINKDPINLNLKQPIPATLSSGKWVKNKAIVRTFKSARNSIIFINYDDTPIGLRNIQFKPLQPEMNMLTLADLADGYNLFTSSKSFEIEEGRNGAIEIKAHADLQYHLNLDKGYKIQIVIEYGNSNVTAEMEPPNKIKNKEKIVKEVNLKKTVTSFGSNHEITITFNSNGLTYPQIVLKPGPEGPIILKRFDVSIAKSPNAAELNPLHR